MPATLSELILDQTETTLIWSNTKTGTTSSYFTSGPKSPPFAQNTEYRMVVSSSASRPASYDIRKLEGSTNRGKIATMPAGAEDFEFTFNTGAYNINKFTITSKIAITYTLKVYLDTKTSLNDRILAIEQEQTDMEAEMDSTLYNYAGYDFKQYTSQVTKTSQTGTVYPWSILPHKVDTSLFCKLDFTNITSTGSVTVRLLLGNTTVKSLGSIAASDTEKTFLFQCSSEFDKVQLMIGSSTITYTAVLSVVSAFYRDAQQHLDYNTKAALFKSGVKSIAHQGFSDDRFAAACRKCALEAAARNMYDGVEVDVLFSSDNVPVLSHDPTFVDGISGNTITIANETLEDLKSYRYYGGEICTLEEAMEVCKAYGMDILLDHTAYIETNAQAQAVVDIINKYKMWKHVIWTTSSSVLTRSAILQLYPQSRVLSVQDGTVTQSNIDAINAVAATGVNIIFDFNYANNTVENVVPLLQGLNPGVEVAVYTLEKGSNPLADSYELWAEYAPYVDYALSGLANEFITRYGLLNIHG